MQLKSVIIIYSHQPPLLLSFSFKFPLSFINCSNRYTFFFTFICTAASSSSFSSTVAPPSAGDQYTVVIISGAMHNSIRIRTYERHWRARRTTTRPPLTVVNEDAEYFKQTTTSLFLSFFLCLYLLSRNTRQPFCQRPLKCVGSFRLFRSPFAFAKIYT